MTENERLEFLTAYEALGPGGLTEAEQTELRDLRLRLTPPAEIDYGNMCCLSIDELNELVLSFANWGMVTNTGSVVWNNAPIVGQP
jgi:hypothetical protein